MQFVSWLDNRTLIACDVMLTMLFSAAFFGMKRTYPNLRGINTIPASFLLGVPGTLLLASRGAIPYFVSVTVANCFLFASFVLLYRGILRFVGSRKAIYLPVAVSCMSLGVLFYFSEIRDDAMPRLVAIAATIGLVRALIALELFRKSSTFPSPTIMRLFAASMTVFAGTNVHFAAVTLLHGATLTGLDTGPGATITLLVGVLALCMTGLFILVLSSSELIAHSRDESQKDVLSGAFNRRGIEAKLALELKHLHRTHQRLSIALIDVDYFEAINDVQGHAAGDAALRDVADTITTHLRGRDYLGRYGGDEFLLILPETSCPAAVNICDRLALAVANLSISTGQKPITLSIGLTEGSPSDDTVTLIARADKALYKAKSDGRNCRRVETFETADPEQVYRAMGLVMRRSVGETPPNRPVQAPTIQ